MFIRLLRCWFPLSPNLPRNSLLLERVQQQDLGSTYSVVATSRYKVGGLWKGEEGAHGEVKGTKGRCDSEKGVFNLYPQLVSKRGAAFLDA